LSKVREFNSYVSRTCDSFVPGLHFPSSGRVPPVERHCYGVKRCVVRGSILETLSCHPLVSMTRRKSCY